MSDASGCVFCAIIRGEVPAFRVYEDDDVIAFLDTRPVFKGHVLVVPRPHVDTLADLPGSAVGPFFLRVQLLSLAIPTALGADGSFVANNNVVSQSVPHLHVHVVPRKKKDGLKGFFWPRTKYASDEEAEAVAARIREALTSTNLRAPATG